MRSRAPIQAMAVLRLFLSSAMAGARKMAHWHRTVLYILAMIGRNDIQERVGEKGGETVGWRVETDFFQSTLRAVREYL
jgi:hypothetical protein